DTNRSAGSYHLLHARGPAGRTGRSRADRSDDPENSPLPQSSERPLAARGAAGLACRAMPFAHIFVRCRAAPATLPEKRSRIRLEQLQSCQWVVAARAPLMKEDQPELARRSAECRAITL